MADLGSIEFRDNSGLSARAKQEGNADILDSLSDLGAIAASAGQEDVLGDLRENLNETTDQISAQVPAAPEVTGDLVFDRLQKLKFSVAQGDTKQQDRASIEGRRLLQDAVARNPRMRSQLLTEFNMFTSGDPEFAALGLQDVAAKSSSTLALAEIEDIKAEAYGDGVGQLGMDPLQFEFGSRQFIDQYNYRKGLEQQRAENALLIGAMDSQRDVDVRTQAGQWQASLLGKREIVSTMIGETQLVAGQVAAAFKEPNDPASAAIISEWNQFGRDQHLGVVNSAIDQMELSFANIDLKWADTAEYRAMENLKNTTVRELRVLSEAIATDSPTLVAVHEAMVAAREMEFEDSNPNLIELGMWLDQVEPIIDNIELLDAGETLIKNDLGLLLKPSLSNLLGRQRGSTGQGQVEPGLDAEDYAASLDQIRLQNPNHEFYGHGIPNTQARQTAAFQDGVLQADLRRKMVDSGVPIAPQYAKNDLGAYYQQIKYLSETGTVPGDAADAQIDTFADDAIVEIIKAARMSDTPAAAQAWGDAAEDFFDKSGGPKGALSRIDRYTGLKNVNVGQGILASEVIVLDESQLEDGTVVFRVNEDAIRQLAPGVNVGIAPFASSTNIQGPIITEARRVAQTLTQLVSRDLQAKAHIEFAQNALAEPDYAGQWETGAVSFASLFGVLGEVEELEVTVQRRESNRPRDRGISRGARIRRGGS